LVYKLYVIRKLITIEWNQDHTRVCDCSAMMPRRCQELDVGKRRRRRRSRHARRRQYVAVVQPLRCPSAGCDTSPAWRGFHLADRSSASLTALAWHWWRHREKYFRPRDVKSRTRRCC